MFRILKNMKGQIGIILIIVVLLFVRAYCDLALPQYTSDIIDVGILNQGENHIIPEQISVDEWKLSRLFMEEEERTLWEDSYTVGEKRAVRKDMTEEELDHSDNVLLPSLLMSIQMSSMEKSQFVEQVASSMDCEKDQVTDEMLHQYMSQFGLPLEFQERDGKEYMDMRPLFQAMIKAKMMSEEDLSSMRAEMEKNMDTMGASLMKSTAISWTVAQEDLMGVDIDKQQKNYLWLAGGKMLVMALLLALAAIGVGFFASRVGAEIGRDLRGKIYGKVMGFSDREMDKFSTASLITRSTNDIQQIQMVITMSLQMVAYAPIIGVGGILKVIDTGAGMGWIIVLAVVVILILVMSLMIIAMPKFKAMQKLVDKLNLVSREILTGLLVIRAFGREKTEEERFEEANINLTKTMLFTNRVMTFMMPAMMFVMYGVSVLIVWVAAGKIDAGNMQVGQMTAFITYTMQIIMSFLLLTMMSIMLPRASVAAGRIEEVLETKASIEDASHARDLADSQGVLAFHQVTFSYPGGEDPVLEDITFEAKPGMTTAIIGSTGSGKSTLINLIPRFYDVSLGSITIDGVDIRQITQSSLREQIGYVPQKGTLFSGTIQSNISYGKEDASIEEIREAAQIAQSMEFIENMEKQFESEIAQGGSNVSGGQKQRLSIARAIAKKPKIYIFDDSFSALDFKTDAALRQALSEQVKDSTVLIVAQRISTILHAEQIIVLDEGKIAGIGTHGELMENCEVYQQIAKSQLSEKELSSQEVISHE